MKANRQSRRQGARGLAASLILACLLPLSGTAAEESTSPPADAGARIVAKAESQIGRHDRDRPLIGRYHGHLQAWCSEFVSWCYFQAGAPMTGGSRDFGLCLKDWNLESASRIIAWFQARHRYYPIEEFPAALEPGPGDYAFITDTDKKRSHSAIVKQVIVEDNGTETLVTIEGNNRGRPVAEYRYPDWRRQREGVGVVGGIGLRDPE